MPNTALDILKAYMKEDNPRQAIVRHINKVASEGSYNDKEMQALQEAYEIADKIFNAGRRIGYKSGIKYVITDMQERHREEEE